MKIQKKLFSKISFPDFEMYKMNVSLIERKIYISIEGAFLDNSKGIVLGQGEIMIKNFSDIEIKLFNDDKIKSLNSKDIDILKSIDEYIYEENKIIFKGFGKNTGKWIEYIIYDPSIEMVFN